jgi:chaperonin cofactor prefoldin
MTHIEDILRLRQTPTEDLVDYLNARIKALENRVEFLESQVEVLKMR